MAFKTMNLAQFVQGFRLFGNDKLSYAGLKRIFENADTDKNGILSQLEFRRMKLVNGPGEPDTGIYLLEDKITPRYYFNKYSDG